MRPTKIFVDGINNRVHQAELRSLFTKYGRVTECDIISTFGFVHMANEDDALHAIRSLDHHKLQGGTLSVMMSRSNGQPADRNRFRRGNYRRPTQGPMFSNRNTFGSRPDPYSNRYQPSSMGRYDSRDRRDNRDGRDSYRDPYDRRGPPPSHRGRDMSPPTNGRPRDHPMRDRSPRDRSPPQHGDPYGVRQDEYGRLVATSREEEERYAAMRRDGRESRPGLPAQYYDEAPREHPPSRSQRPEYDYPSQSRGGDGRYYPNHEAASQQRYSSRSTSSSRSDSRDRARRPVHRDSSGSPRRRRSPSPRRRQRHSTGSSVSSGSSRSASPRQRQRQRRPAPAQRHARRHSSESSSPRRRASSHDSSQSPPPPPRRHRGRPPSPPSPPSSPDTKPRRQRSTHDVSEAPAKRRHHQDENDGTVAPPPEPAANNSDSGSPKRRRKHKDRTKSRSSKKKSKKTAS